MPPDSRPLGSDIKGAALDELAMSGIRKRPVRSASRATLLAAGTELFARHGYSGTSVERIARRARVNRAMVSYHFGGKMKLYRCALEAGLGGLAARMGPIHGSSAPAPERLRALVAAFGAVATEQAHFPTLMLREILAGGHRLDRELMAHLVSIFGLVREVVEQGVRQRSFRRVDPLLTHLSLIGSLVFFFATTPARNRLIRQRSLPLRRAPSAAEYVRHIQELVTFGLAAPASPPVGKVGS